MNQKSSGFTIIEVALVLAIAGLIFLMAFIALPSLWASQRDADRKANVMAIISDIKTYQTNNSRGALPVLNGSGPETVDTGSDLSGAASSTWAAFARDYMDNDLVDPNGIPYQLYVVKCATETGDVAALGINQACNYPSNTFGTINNPENVNIGTNVNYTMYIAIGATCDGDHAVKTNSSRNVAAVYVLERAGRYCYNT